MRTIVFALLAYLVLTGCAILWSRLLKLYLAEGMLLAACIVAAVLYVAGRAANFRIGMILLIVLGVGGYVFALIQSLTGAGPDSGKTKRTSTASGVGQAAKSRQEKAWGLLSPYFIVLTLLFIFSVIIYFGDFIWHIDEFHLYAASPKYMLENGTLPLHIGRIGGAEKVLGTSLFHLFFQMFTGYNEGMMYASAALISWIGMLLPFAASGCREDKADQKGVWINILLYTAILYIGMYSLYLYGSKNLYVDIPTVSWAGGLAGWWMMQVPRRKGRGQYLVGGAGIVMITMMKPHIGLLMAVLVFGFMCLETYRVSRESKGAGGGRLEAGESKAGRTEVEQSESGDSEARKEVGEPKAGSTGAAQGKQRRKWLLLPIALVALAVACGVFVWSAGGSTGGVGNFLSALGTNLRERIRPTTIAFVTSVVGAPLSRRSALGLSMPVMLLIISGLFVLGGDLKSERKRGCTYLVYALVAWAAFMIALYGAFLFIFTYEESIKVAGARRYYTCIIWYLLIMALTWMLVIPARAKGREETSSFRKTRYVAFGLLIFFALGLNEDYIPNATALNKQEAIGYKDIKRTRDEARSVQKLLQDGERVYFLNQDGSNEFPTNVALYYLGDSVSNYLAEPWKFTETGSIIRVKEGEQPSIADLPALLAAGSYDYLWIYETDDYLKETLSQVLDVDTDELSDGSVLRVIYDESGMPSALEVLA